MNDKGATIDLAIHTILELIRKNGPITRSELCDRSGFSRSTVSINCDRLLALGLIEEESIILRGAAGKRTKLGIRGGFGTIVGIELGATSAEIGLCDLSSKVIEFISLPLDLGGGPDLVLDLVGSRIDGLFASSGMPREKLLGIGVGLPARVDYRAGMAIHPAFMPGWDRYPVRDILSRRFGRPVFVDNEVNAMALGEYHLGAGRAVRNLVYVKAGTGIGAGIIVDGSIYRGETGFAGNLGHYPVEGRSEACECGRSGCLEAIAGGAAIAKRARRLVEEGRSPILAALAEREGHCGGKEVRLAAEAGDPACIELIREAGSILGEQVGRLAFLLDPGLVIIGGGLAGFGPAYIAYVREGIFRALRPWVSADLEVLPSSFGEKGGVVGAALLCANELFARGALIS